MIQIHEYTTQNLQKITHTLLSFVYAVKKPTTDNLNVVLYVSNIITPVSIFCVLGLGLFWFLLPFAVVTVLPGNHLVRAPIERKERKMWFKRVNKGVTTNNILAIISSILGLIVHICVYNAT